MTDDPISGGEPYATAAQAAVHTAVVDMDAKLRNTVVDQVNAAYRDGWADGYTAGLADGRAEPQ